MDWKKNRLLVGIAALAGLVALTVWAMSRQEEQFASDTEQQLPEPPEVQADAIDELAIEHADKGSVKLVKQGGEWKVAAPLKAPADQNAVETALDKLEELSFTGIAATNEKLYDRLEVGKDQALRVIARKDGKAVADLILGAYKGGNTMVRVQGPEAREEVFAAEGSIKWAFDKELKDWRDRRVVDVEPQRVSAVSFQNDKGTFQFARSKEDDDLWVQVKASKRAKGIKDFDSSRVESVVATLARLRASDFADPSVTPEQAGLGEGAAVATLTVLEPAPTQEAKDEAEDEGPAEEQASAPEQQAIVLLLGDKVKDGDQRYLQRKDNDTIFVTTSFSADRIAPGSEEFQKKEEAASEEPGLEEQMHGQPGGPGQKLPPGIEAQLRRQLQQQAQQ